MVQEHILRTIRMQIIYVVFIDLLYIKHTNILLFKFTYTFKYINIY